MASIFVDADSITKKHREIIIRRSLKENIETYFVSDRDLKDVREVIREDTNNKREGYRGILNKEDIKKIKSNIHTLKVEVGENSADDKIVELASKTSLVITHDIPLAKRLIDKGSLVIDDRGNILNEENINERLSMRDFMKGLREAGLEEEKNKRFDSKIYSLFSASFDKELNILLKMEKI